MLDNLIGKQIRKLREKKGWTQIELADIIGKKMERSISHDAIGTYERGVRVPPSDVLLAIANVFNVSLDYLTERSGSLYDLETEHGDLSTVVAAMFRAHGILTADEKERLVNVLRAGWPEIFKQD